MPKIPLQEAFYEARSLVADAQQCMNLFPERNPQDAEAPMSFYPTPGLVTLNSAAASGGGSGLSGWRCLYEGANKTVYGVCGNTVYMLSPSFAPTALGVIDTIGTPVYMTDNGTTLVLVDGSASGYQITLATNAFAAITDPNFLGADRIDYLDTFFVSNVPGTREFQSSLSNEAAWDALFFASKSGDADLLQTLMVVHREIWLLGEHSTEVWFDAGGATFPFAILPGVYVEQGIGAKYSVATYDLLLFWLDVNPYGTSSVMMGKAYTAQRISTHAIEKEISSYEVITDAVGFIYQQEGHTFYVLQFITAGKTWVYDLASGKWHQRAWYNTTTQQQELWRPSCALFTNGTLLAGDWQNSNLYRVDLDTYTDFGGPIVRVKSFPHLISDGKRVHYSQFSADMEAGGLPYDGVTQATQDPAWLSLRWSDDRGQTYGNNILQDLGQEGNFLTQPKWSRLGMARDRVFELSWSIPTKTALNGAYIDVVPFES